MSMNTRVVENKTFSHLWRSMDDDHDAALLLNQTYSYQQKVRNLISSSSSSSSSFHPTSTTAAFFLPTENGRNEAISSACHRDSTS